MTQNIKQDTTRDAQKVIDNLPIVNFSNSDSVKKPRIKAKLELVAKDKDGNITGTYCNEDDLFTKQFAQMTQLNIFNTAETITTTSNVAEALTVNNAATAPTIVAGTGTTAAAVTDYNLQSQSSGTSGSVAATINAYSGSGTSGHYTITGTITNSSGGNITYSEVGLEVTVATYVFLLTHDVFTGLVVSNLGTLAVTYTLTFS